MQVLPMKTTIRVTKLLSSDSSIKFSIDSPKESTVAGDHRHFIKLKGWFFSEVGEAPELVLDTGSRVDLPALIERPDVALAYDKAPACCGFETLLELGVNAKLGYTRGSGVEWLASIVFERVSVLIGHDEYLFLDHDSNRSVSQYRGDLLIDKQNLTLWREYFAKIAAEEQNHKFKSAFLMAPGKEYIFPEHYPVIRSGTTPADQFISHFSEDISIINPTTQLITERNFTYSKVDTHWTHYGARVAARLVCQHFNQTFVNPDFNYKYTRTSGDLGSKFSPPRTEVVPLPDYSSVNQYRIFDNKVLNRGRVHIYQNNDTINKATCLIFGDSFSTPLIIYLVFSFARVVHIFSGADIDWSIVHNEQPDFLLAEMTTRFFIKSPSAKFSLKTELLRKCSGYSDSQRRSAITNLDRFNDPSVQFYRSMAADALKIADQPGLPS